jgi:hypothetical protein
MRPTMKGFSFGCREAAKQIEDENNMGKDMWEIDLHGLHRQEAEMALDKRSVHPGSTLCHFHLLATLCPAI